MPIEEISRGVACHQLAPLSICIPPVDGAVPRRMQPRTHKRILSRLDRFQVSAIIALINGAPSNPNWTPSLA